MFKILKLALKLGSREAVGLFVSTLLMWLGLLLTIFMALLSLFFAFLIVDDGPWFSARSKFVD